MKGGQSNGLAVRSLFYFYLSTSALCVVESAGILTP
jgi:hypothetical protein